MSSVEIPSQFYDEEGELVEDERFFAWLRTHAVKQPPELDLEVRRHLAAVMNLLHEASAHLEGAVDRLIALTAQSR